MSGLGARQFTLSQMGVSQWYSRRELKGAADTPLQLHSLDATTTVRLSDKDEADLTCGSVEISTATKLETTSSALEILHATSEVKDLKIPDKSLEITASQKTESNVVIQGGAEHQLSDAFSLKLYRTKYAIILSEAGTETSDQETSMLLNNILKMTSVITENADKCQYLGTFTWPIFKAIPSADDACTRLLSRWVSSHTNSDDVAYLFFGNTQVSANSFCQNVVVSAADISSEMLAISFPNALSELIALPSLKLRVWDKMIESGLVG